MKHALIIGLLSLAAVAGTPAVAVAADSLAYTVIRGTVRDAATRHPLPRVAVYLENADIATVSNAEGLFILKIPDGATPATVVVSHLL